MTVLHDIYKAAHPADGVPPREILIQPAQIEPLVKELNALRAYPFEDVPKLTEEDFRINGGWLYGIPVRVAT